MIHCSHEIVHLRRNASLLVLNGSLCAEVIHCSHEIVHLRRNDSLMVLNGSLCAEFIHYIPKYAKLVR
jgi:hypothetical protein